MNGPYFFDATRGARTFGEIGHEVTLGRSTRVIVNKLSTMTQNSVHAARPLVARRSRTRSVKRTPLAHLLTAYIDTAAQLRTNGAPSRAMQILAPFGTGCRQCCAQENASSPLRESDLEGAPNLKFAALRFKELKSTLASLT